MASISNRPPSLAELQRWLRWVFTEPRGVAAALADPEDGPAPPCQQFVAVGPPLGRAARLDIYAEAYFARLVDSLAQSFPAVYRVLGDDAFRGLASSYLDTHPSTSSNIEEAGRHLPAFLRKHELTWELPFLPDLATLEWAVIEAFYADDRPPLDTAALAGVPQEAWAEARILLDPSVLLLRSDWPIDDLWEARAVPDDELSIELEGQPRSLLVHRYDDTVRVAAIDEHQFAALQMLAAGHPLQAVCEALALRSDDTGEDPPVMNWFAAWIGAGVIRRIEFAEVAR